ncbi:hypothetical protein [Plantactinospora veratri]
MQRARATGLLEVGQQRTRLGGQLGGEGEEGGQQRAAGPVRGLTRRLLGRDRQGQGFEPGGVDYQTDRQHADGTSRRSRMGGK